MKMIVPRLLEQTIQVLSDSWHQAARVTYYVGALWRQRELQQATRSAAE